MCEIELDQNIATDQNSSPKTKTEAKRSYQWEKYRVVRVDNSEADVHEPKLSRISNGVKALQPSASADPKAALCQ